MNDSAALIWCPFATSDEARKAAQILVTEQLIACANIIPGIVSVFTWQDQVQEAEEVGLLCKTLSHSMPKAIARLAEIYTYDTPAIAGWLVDKAPPETLAWLSGSLTNGVENEQH